ncbi:pyridoxal phosphate-dependent aminotransferase [Erythrobacter dokdonensis]|uniref:Histidinol-phosphate aminotransferase n=1 Tax=Erythrobacter dokdonensis DSW-74 TaxID=1300349 RepID=A0A1A7BI12_9SPHN|nr:histidinol-phosphate transaminase [Erythrobacter dokdonensis]OBV11351.1 Histidinol-phosphate aminotransferase [Erythrobacter dokdonensis DSW-74]
MPTNRRSFLAGAGLAGGLGTIPFSGLGSTVTGAAAVPHFGPKAGQALLSRNENPYGPAPSALRAIAETAKMGCYYADRGLQRLAAMIAERHGVMPTQVVVGEGSTEILCAISLAWGREGAILCPDLFWDTTVLYGERQGVSSIRVPLAEDMSVDLSAMAARIGDGVALVQICNPNNPTGMLIPPDALRSFAAKVTPQATLLVDEAYNELTDRPEDSSMIDLVRSGADVIVCRTFSKIYGMAGLRVGYAITSEANARRIQSHMMSFGGNIAGLAAAIASYDDTPFLDQSRSAVLEGRAMILDAVGKAGLTALPSQTNFVFVKVPDANSLRDAMAERGIAIRGAYGSWSGYSRVSTGRMEDVSRYASALPELAQELWA